MRNIAIILAFFLSGCASQNVSLQNSASRHLAETEVYLESGLNQLSNGNAIEAIADFEKAIEICNDEYTNDTQKVYASRGTAETLYYLMRAAADGEEAIAIAPACAEVLYYKGYASLDLGLREQAEVFINKAIDMSPVNSMYLSELGHIYQSKGEWESALEIFTRAEESANIYTPPELKKYELGRTKRGVGFSLIELGRINEAEKKFIECLRIDKNDEGALKELNYIEYLRSSVP